MLGKAHREPCERALLLADATAHLFDGVKIDEVPRNAGVPVDALAKARVISDIVRQTLADHDAAQDLVTRIPDRMCKPALAVANEVPGPNRVLVFSDDCSRVPGEHKDAFVLVIVTMVLGRLVAWLDLDQVETESGQARYVA